MCANPKTIREIMIAAEELNMIDSGEYVFFNVEIFGSLTSQDDLQPWNDPTDEVERNNKAKKAFEAVLTITTKKPEDKEYEKFSEEVWIGFVSFSYLFRFFHNHSLFHNFPYTRRSNYSRKRNTTTRSANMSKLVSLFQHFMMRFYYSLEHSTRV